MPTTAALLDTHVVIWALVDPSKLSKDATDVLRSQRCYVSAASYWEVAIKHAKDALPLGALRPQDLFEAAVSDLGVVEIPITGVHALHAGALPAHHHDPFDRMLVAQAGDLQLCIVSSDAALQDYEVPVVW